MYINGFAKTLKDVSGAFCWGAKTCLISSFGLDLMLQKYV
jgi:hypothetical protein